MGYVALKHIHVTCVALSATGFAVRGMWMLADSPRLAQRWVRITPHVVDTVLLGSAIALAVMTQQYPIAQSWLTAKVVGLLAYIVLGSIALRRGRTKVMRVTAWFGALCALGYIISVALSRDARGVFAYLGG